MSAESGREIAAPEFRDPAALAAEAQRVYDICASCRRCYNLCPSFTQLLDTIDERHDGDGNRLEPAEERTVVDLCFSCQLCYPHCPYTPPHRWAIDFPRLMIRAACGAPASEGVPLRERLLGNPELIGEVGHPDAGARQLGRPEPRPAGAPASVWSASIGVASCPAMAGDSAPGSGARRHRPRWAEREGGALLHHPRRVHGARHRECGGSRALA